MPLKVNLRAGERIIINGALISVSGNVELTFLNHAALMLERQLIRPEEANTPARRIYFAVQNAYVANDSERPEWIGRALAFVDEYDAATVSPVIRAKTEAIRAHVASGEFYAALKLARELFGHDDLMIPAAAIPTPPPFPGRTARRRR